MSRDTGAPVVIIGAGLGGLAVGQALRRKGVPAILFDKSMEGRRSSYGLSLMQYPRNDNVAVVLPSRQQIAVASDLAIPKLAGEGNDNVEASFRANRSRLESHLREGLDVRWEHSLENVEESGTGLDVYFTNGNNHAASMLIASDGVHSAVRKQFAPEAAVNVLPYAVYNSRRRVPMSEWKTSYQPHFRDKAPTYTLVCHISKTRFEIAVNDFRAEDVDISCNFSRPAKGHDELHNPNRPLADAKVIPGALFEELADVSDRLKGPFAHAFDPERTRQSKVLHWLMRTTLVELDKLKQLARLNIVFIGDAAHAVPIVGSSGAMQAMQDGIILADFLAHGKSDPLSRFYDCRYEKWASIARQAEDGFARLHERPEKLA
ncbi:MAG: hypothetical protein M1828_003048 [Chrysothrix sp. TS-e1954]|nr:MAG: hypothetical protein M1828_003048 [Chrysothrix sp. TS-e1954]